MPFWRSSESFAAAHLGFFADRATAPSLDDGGMWLESTYISNVACRRETNAAECFCFFSSFEPFFAFFAALPLSCVACWLL